MYDTKKEGLYFFKDACVDHSVGNQYADLYIPLYDHWKVFIWETADQLDFSAVSSVGNISGIPFLLYDDHAFYKVKICVQLAKIFHLHQWEKERRIR